MFSFYTGAMWANISYGIDLPSAQFDEWLQDLDAYAQGPQQVDFGASNPNQGEMTAANEMNPNQGEVVTTNEINPNQDQMDNAAAKDEDKASNALLDARLKVIEERLNIVKAENEKVRTEVKVVDGVELIEILDDEDEDESFCPKATPTRIKEEMDKEE